MLDIIPAAAIALPAIAAAGLFINATRHPTDTHMPVGNPYRVGATVLICEDITRPEMNWFGTVLQTSGGMLTVRDTVAPYASVQLAKDAVYPASANLGW